ncbi:EamA family transporter [Altererythrobacter salegens]|uniref:EamA family transporter n=1 Tax=Croceibacterium salegens TaxID=1737568 RepID=A0A6I4SSY9_9SPHN|nr:DMT family transporter [Croceibacterium salegens]MXO59074.1 EamA family transporter [Croceibacterium salegens]
MQDAGRQYRAFALLGVVMVLWAGNSIVGRAVRLDVPPLTLAWVRWAGASLIVLPLAWRSLRRDWPTIRQNWMPVLLLGLLGVAAFNSLLYSGLRYTTATNALLLQAAVPAVVVVLDRLFFAVRSPLVQNIGVAASIVGVAAIVFEGDPARALTLHFGLGDLLVLASVVVWALYTVLLRLRPKISPISFVAATFIVGAVVLAPFAARDWLSGDRIVWGPGVLAAFAYVCVLPSIVAYFMFNHATQVVGAARAGLAITLMPIFGALLSAALLGEKLHSYHFAGMAMILAGIALSVMAMRRQAGAGAGGTPPLGESA